MGAIQLNAVLASYSPTVRAARSEAWPQSPSVSFRHVHPLAEPNIDVEVGPASGEGVAQVLKAAVAQLKPLLQLGNRWDGARARKVDENAAIWSLWVIADLVSDALVMPQLFPLPDGGIQLEWLIDGNGLEIDIAPSGEIGILGVDRTGFSRVDGEDRVGGAFGPIEEARAYLREIAKPLLG